MSDDCVLLSDEARTFLDVADEKTDEFAQRSSHFSRKTLSRTRSARQRDASYRWPRWSFSTPYFAELHRDIHPHRKAKPTFVSSKSSQSMRHTSGTGF